MITLYTFGPHFGLPDPSPFVTKADMLLKLAKVPHATATMEFGKAPKGKIPYIGEDGMLLGDSTFIRFHLERKHNIDFSGGYRPPELALAWSVEKMLEEHLYWVMVAERWMNESNFERGPAEFFRRAPAPIRPFVRVRVRRKVRKALHAQGIGRHSAAERSELGKCDIDAVAEIMGENRYLLGDRPCGADATVYAFLLGIMCPLFESETGRYAEAKVNLVDYVKRMTAEFYPNRA